MLIYGVLDVGDMFGKVFKWYCIFYKVFFKYIYLYNLDCR